MLGLKGLRGWLSAKGGSGAPGSQPNHQSSGALMAGGAVLSGTAARQAAASMLVGMNLTEPVYYLGPSPWANLMWMAARWQKSSDFTNWPTQNQGLISGAAGTDENLCVISMGSVQLPAGTYTWRNPDGCNIGITTVLGQQNKVAYTTATSGTFTLAQNDSLFVYAKGNVTNNAGTPAGGLQIILPDHVTSWDSGNYVNSQYADFHNDLGTRILRTMDWTVTNNNFEDVWADRATLGRINQRGLYSQAVSWEAIINLANVLGKPLWINIPVRATDAYVTSLAQLFASTYNPSTLYVEYGNEIWNTGPIIFIRNTNWVNYLPHTRVLLAASTSTFTKATHGYANDKQLRGFAHKQSLEVQNVDENNLSGYWEGNAGQVLYVKVLTADTFELWTAAGGTGTRITLPSTVTNFWVIDPAEAGKETNLHINYRTRAKQIWDLFDTHFGASKTKATMAGQNAVVSMASNRITGAPGTRADYYATAPYWRGAISGAAVDRSTGQFQLKAWASHAGTYWASVYTQGSVPTRTQRKAGTGTGFIATRTAAYSTSSGYSNIGSAVTGLTDGVTYTVFFDYQDPDGYTWSWSGDVQASASASTVDVFDTYVNQRLRALQDMDNVGSDTTQNLGTQAAALLSAIQAGNANCKLVAYEAGNHQDTGTNPRPSAINTWMENWFEDSTYAQALVKYLKHAACAGYSAMCVFRDIAADGGPWAIADSNYDQTDQRYTAVSALAGAAPTATLLNVSNVTGTRVTSAPGSYPSVVHTFSGSLTYTLVCNNDNGNFDINGQTVRLINGAHIDFNSDTQHVLRLLAEDSNSFSLFNFTINTGPSTWYDGGALYAWKSTTDTNNAEVNSDLGGVLALTGTGATISGGLWNGNSNSSYENTNGLTAAIDTGNPVLVVQVLNKGTAGSFATSLEIGQFPDIISTWWFTDGGERLLWRLVNSPADNSYNAGPVDATTRAYWVFYRPSDNKIFYGNGQNLTNANGSSGETLGMTFPTPNRFTKFTSTPFNYGTVEVVNRSDLTLTQALSIVQSIQDIHGV